MMTLCVRVPKKNAEEARRTLMALGVMDFTHRLRAEGGDILIPVTEIPEGFPTEDADLDEQEKRIGDYRDITEIPEELKQYLPSSFDIVGDIAIMKIPDELSGYQENLGNALLKTSPNIRAVFSDAGVKGEFRIRELKRIAGTGNAETIHKENGTRLMTDPSKVYFNPRLSAERARVASLVKPGEVIIDMFAGVAPFGCVICRNASPAAVYSIDLNPECEHFARENARLNHITNLHPMTGDSTVLVKSLPKADRVLMNIPQIADRFLPDALGCVKPSGMIHMHKVLERDETEIFIKNIENDMAARGTPVEVISCIELKNYSPTKGVYVFDIVPQRILLFRTRRDAYPI